MGTRHLGLRKSAQNREKICGSFCKFYPYAWNIPPFLVCIIFKFLFRDEEVDLPSDISDFSS